MMGDPSVSRSAMSDELAKLRAERDSWREITLCREAEKLKLIEQLAECRAAHGRRNHMILPLAAPAHVLKAHYLAGIECDHERKMDKPACACSLVNLGWHPNVGSAVDAWIEHVLEVSRHA